MYKKVLLPVSGKKHGERAHQALKHALGLCSGEIILLHVTEPLSQIVGGEAHTELKREEAAKGLTLLCPLIEILEKTASAFTPAWKRAPRRKPLCAWLMRKTLDLIVMSPTDATASAIC